MSVFTRPGRRFRATAVVAAVLLAAYGLAPAGVAGAADACTNPDGTTMTGCVDLSGLPPGGITVPISLGTGGTPGLTGTQEYSPCEGALGELTDGTCDYAPGTDPRVIQDGTTTPITADPVGSYRTTAGGPSMTPRELAALRDIEQTALEAVRAQHGLTDGSNVRLQTWDRDDVRAAMFLLIIGGILTPPAQRTADQQAAADWMQGLVKTQNLDTALDAQDQYNLYKSNQAPHRSYCTYKPPVPFQDEFPGTAALPEECFEPSTNTFGDSALTPTVDQFTRWGAAAAGGRFDTAPFAVISGHVLDDLIGFGAGVGAGITTGLGAVALNALTTADAVLTNADGVDGAVDFTETFFDRIFPYVFRGGVTGITAGLPEGATVSAEAALEAGDEAVAGVAAAQLAGVVITVVTAIVTAVIQGIAVVKESEIPAALQTAVDNATNAQPDVAALATSGDGLPEMYSLFIAATINPAPPAPLAVPDRQITDGFFGTTAADGTVTADTGFDYSDGLCQCTSHAELRSGFWHITQLGVDYTTLELPYIDQDGQHRLAQHVVVDGHDEFLSTPEGVTTVEGARSPPTVAGCRPEDDCLLHQFLDLQSGAGQPETVTFRDTAAPDAAVAIPSGTIVDGGGIARFSLETIDGRVLDGSDGTHYSWAFSTDPNSFPAPQTTGAVVGVAPLYRGYYYVRVVASDKFDTQVAHTTEFYVHDGGPPTPALITAPTVAEGTPTTASGQLFEFGTRDAGTLHVNWGDGTNEDDAYDHTVRTFAPTHTYATAGTYTITMSATDDDNNTGNTNTATAVVTNLDPVLSGVHLDGGSEGTTATLTGTVADVPADTGTLHIGWGDGSSNDIAYTPGPFSVTHTYANPGVPTVTVTATEGNGGTATTTTSAAVVDTPPSVSGLSAVVAHQSQVHLTGTVSDPGAEVGAVDIDWGDGTTSVVPYAAPGSDQSGGTVSLIPSSPFATDHVYTTLSDTPYVIGVHAVEDLGVFGATVTTTALAQDIGPTIGPLTITGLSEGTPTTVTGTTFDPGLDDTCTVYVDWGDGTQGTVPCPSTGPFSASHVYADQGRYLVTTYAYDQLGVAGAQSTATYVDIANVAPVVSGLTARSIDENGVATFTAQLVDPGLFDVGFLTVDWGDGSAPDVIGYAAGTRSITFSHTYVDDGPKGTAKVVYPVSVTAEDKDGGTTTTATTVTVHNVAPTATVTVVHPDPLVRGVLVDVPYALSITESDPGTLDAHTVTVLWGDGTATTRPISGTLRITHVARAVGTVPVTVVVSDDDRGSVTVPVPVSVISAAATVPVVTSLLAKVLTTRPGKNVAYDVQEALVQLDSVPGLLGNHDVTDAMTQLYAAASYLALAQGTKPRVDVTTAFRVLAVATASVATTAVRTAAATAATAVARRLVRTAQADLAVGNTAQAAHYYLDAVTAYRTAVDDLG